MKTTSTKKAVVRLVIGMYIIQVGETIYPQSFKTLKEAKKVADIINNK